MIWSLFEQHHQLPSVRSPVERDGSQQHEYFRSPLWSAGQIYGGFRRGHDRPSPVSYHLSCFLIPWEWDFQWENLMRHNLFCQSLELIQGPYNYLMVDLRDPRVDDWFLMSSIWPTTAICILYVYIVKVLPTIIIRVNQQSVIMTMISGGRPEVHGEQGPVQHQVDHDSLQFLPDSLQLLDVCRERDLLRDGRLQLALSASGLLSRQGRHQSAQSRLVVFLLQVHRPAGHHLLHHEEEVRPGVDPARHPPQHPALAVLVGAEVCRRGPGRIRSFPELRSEIFSQDQNEIHKIFIPKVFTPWCTFTTCVRPSALEFRNISGGRNTSQLSSLSSLSWSSFTPFSRFSSHASSLKRPR